MTKQPEALLALADRIEEANECPMVISIYAADELRRLHEVNAELLAALELALPQIDTSTHSGDRAWDAVKELLNKATGETE